MALVRAPRVKHEQQVAVLLQPLLNCQPSTQGSSHVRLRTRPKQNHLRLKRPHSSRATALATRNRIACLHFALSTMHPDHPVNQSLQQTDENSWLFGGCILLTRQASPSPGCPSWGDGNRLYYVVSTPPSPLPPSGPLPAESQIKKLYDAGGVSAVWRMGDAICKARKHPDQNMTWEHVTLEHLHNKCPLGKLSFAVSTVSHHARGQDEDRYFIIQSRMPGTTLSEAWPSMDESTREYYVSRVAGVCKELAAWTGDGVHGVDGRNLSDLYLTPLHGVEDMSPRSQRHRGMEYGYRRSCPASRHTSPPRKRPSHQWCRGGAARRAYGATDSERQDDGSRTRCETGRRQGRRG